MGIENKLNDNRRGNPILRKPMNEREKKISNLSSTFTYKEGRQKKLSGGADRVVKDYVSRKELPFGIEKMKIDLSDEDLKKTDVDLKKYEDGNKGEEENYKENLTNEELEARRKAAELQAIEEAKKRIKDQEGQPDDKKEEGSGEEEESVLEDDLVDPNEGEVESLNFKEAIDLIQGMTNSFERSRAIESVASAFAKAGRFDKALDFIRSMEENEEYQSMLICQSIIPAFTEAGRIDEALDLAQSMVNERDRAIAIADIVPTFVKEGHPDEALDLAQSMADEMNKARVIASIASALAKAGDLDKALNLAQGMEYSGYKVKAIADIVLTFAKEGHLDEALDLAQSMVNERDRAIAIADIVPVFAEAGRFDEIFSLIHTAGLQTQPDIVISIAPTLVEAGRFDEILNSILAMNEFSRVEAIEGIAPIFAEAGHLDEIFNITQYLSDKTEKEEAIAAIVKAKVQSVEKNTKNKENKKEGGDHEADDKKEEGSGEEEEESVLENDLVNPEDEQVESIKLEQEGKSSGEERENKDKESGAEDNEEYNNSEAEKAYEKFFDKSQESKDRVKEIMEKFKRGEEISAKDFFEVFNESFEGEFYNRVAKTVEFGDRLIGYGKRKTRRVLEKSLNISKKGVR